MSLYTIEFFDGIIFEGGSLESPNWLEIPDKKIKKLTYNLPNKDKIILENYDAYYHFVECYFDLNSLKAGQKQLEYAYLIGKKDATYKVHKINLQSSQVEKKILDENNGFILELNPIGWR